MSEEALVAAPRVIEDVADRVREDMAARDQILRLDADPDAWLAIADDVREGLVELTRLASGSAPPGCELLLSAARPARRVAAAGEGRLVLRWQWAFPESPGPDGDRDNVVRLHPPPSSPAAFLGQGTVRALFERFEAEGFVVDVEVLAEGQEICASLSGPTR